MTTTCCLDCKTQPCPHGLNCRENRQWWCKRFTYIEHAKKQCMGSCREFTLEDDETLELKE